MNLDLKGKNVLVGGSSKGIGKACAIELALLGANVTLVSRSAGLLAEVLHELDTSRGQNHDFLVADFNDRDDLHRKVTGLESEKPVHILINNTGGPKAGPLLDAKAGDFLAAFNNHILCNQLLARLLIPGMIRESYGRIINIISTSVKAPIDDLGVSNTIRAAVANWAKTLANEMGPYGITVNNVLPGFTDTERLQELMEKKASTRGVPVETVIAESQRTIPMKRFGTTAEIAAAAAFLASPAASYITGTNITVDGGRTRSL